MRFDKMIDVLLMQMRRRRAPVRLRREGTRPRGVLQDHLPAADYHEQRPVPLVPWQPANPKDIRKEGRLDVRLEDRRLQRRWFVYCCLLP